MKGLGVHRRLLPLGDASEPRHRALPGPQHGKCGLLGGSGDLVSGFFKEL